MNKSTKIAVALMIIVSVVLTAQYVVYQDGLSFSHKRVADQESWRNASKARNRFLRIGEFKPIFSTKFSQTSLTMEQNETLFLRLQQASLTRKYILFWNDHRNKTGRNVTESLTCGGCVTTKDQTMINHPDTKAVVILYKRFDWESLKSLKRRRDQLFVWYTAESPASLLKRHFLLANETAFQFNLTQTYRRDSGIYHPYGIMTDMFKYQWAIDARENLSTIMEKKSRLAVAVVSNCNGTTGALARMKIINKMKSLGLQLDTFGRCFANRLPQRHHEYEQFLGKYKFFLSFENSVHCKDYITEKFFTNGYRSGTVPVVFGATREDYDAVAPKGSFIFYEDFSSTSSLVNYMEFLDKNHEEYLKYFRWVQEGPSSIPGEPEQATRFCRLCRIIHGINIDDMYDPRYNQSRAERPLFTDGIAPRYVPDLRKWYYGTENYDCWKTITQIKDLLGFDD